MISALIRIFIKDYENVTDPDVRGRYGMLSGIVGIFFNICLFVLKLIAGLISGSIAVTADAFNNLSDAASSIITLIGFKMAGQEPDPDHPFGHGRIEYIAGLLVSILIILMGYESCKSAIEKTLHPEDTTISLLVVGILVASILVKCYMYLYNHKLGKVISSATMEATAKDSLSDTLSTLVVLIASIIGYYTGWHIDGPCGLLISLVILYAGYSAAKETISPLLGGPADPDFVNQIIAIVDEYDDILGIHDLIVHDYGPGRVLVSLHAEVPATGDIMVLHDTIDLVEQRLHDDLHCQAVIHLDPIMNEDEETNEFKDMVNEIIKAYDERLTMHDFRIVKGPTHTNLIFDVVVPFKTSYSVDELKSAISKNVQKKKQNCFCVIQIDHPLTAQPN